MEPRYPDRFSRFVHWLPRPLGSLVLGLGGGVAMAPVLIWIGGPGPGRVREGLVLAAIVAVLGALAIHWLRVQYGDFKYPAVERAAGRELSSALMDDGGGDPEGSADA